jgi:hypothetical protein
VPLIVVNWNVQWAPPTSRRRDEILKRIDRHLPEIICLTETHIELLPPGGHTTCSQPDYGHPIREGRRKVLLWSNEPWLGVDDVGSDSMPHGRFVPGATQTCEGESTVIGICIPWAGSRVYRTEPTRKRWNDHK